MSGSTQCNAIAVLFLTITAAAHIFRLQIALRRTFCSAPIHPKLPQLDALQAEMPHIVLGALNPEGKHKLKDSGNMLSNSMAVSWGVLDLIKDSPAGAPRILVQVLVLRSSSISLDEAHVRCSAGGFVPTWMVGRASALAPGTLSWP